MMRFKNAIGGNKNVTPKGCFFIKDFALRAIFLPLPLTSELDALFGGNANLFPRLRLENKVEPGLMLHHEKQKSHSEEWRFPWWSIKDSNLGPTGYEPVALTN